VVFFLRSLRFTTLGLLLICPPQKRKRHPTPSPEGGALPADWVRKRRMCAPATAPRSPMPT